MCLAPDLSELTTEHAALHVVVIVRASDTLGIRVPHEYAVIIVEDVGPVGIDSHRGNRGSRESMNAAPVAADSRVVGVDVTSDLVALAPFFYTSIRRHLTMCHGTGLPG